MGGAARAGRRPIYHTPASLFGLAYSNSCAIIIPNAQLHARAVAIETLKDGGAMAYPAHAPTPALRTYDSSFVCVCLLTYFFSTRIL